MKTSTLNFLLFISLLVSSCHNNTSLDSDEFEDTKKRVERLEVEIKAFSKIKDAEFDLFNVNGFANDRSMSVPGASSYRYEFAIKIDTADIYKWKVGMVEMDSAIEDETWTKKIIVKRKHNWITTSKAKHYIREGEQGIDMIVYEQEGIIFKSVVHL